MATNLINQQPQRGLMPVSNVFANEPLEDLGEGIRSALGQLSILQNVFGINYRGSYESLPPEQQRQIEVVIIKSAKTQSKAYWPGGYGGDSRPPTCWSSNSITPDVSVPEDQVQNNTCATCPNNVFVTSQNGLKSKPCGDNKRLAVTPVSDLWNEAYGGAMIFRVPAGSLGALDKYANELKKFGINYYAYTTTITITIEPQRKVTKLVFEPGRPLTDDEALIIKELREDEKSGRIVNEVTAEYEGEEATPEQNAAQAQPPKAAATAPKPVGPKPVAPQQHNRSAAEQIATRAEPRQAQPLRPTAPAAKPVQAANTITGAVSKPATAPVTQRQVVTEPPVEEETDEVTEMSNVPDEMDTMFGDLIKR